MIHKIHTALFVILAYAVVGVSAVYAAGDSVPDYASLSQDLPIIGSGMVSSDLTKFSNGLLGISVGFASIMAVIMLSVGGFKYMTSDSVFNMGDAKEQITDAVVGLLIVLGAVLVLGFINPEITSMNFFKN